MNLGVMYLRGEFVERDLIESYAWLDLSAQDPELAEQGTQDVVFKHLDDAQYLLALELFSGARFKKNPEQALFWLKEAATQKPAARLRYAWVLATHPDDNVRSGSLAHSFWESLDEDYPDRQRYYMTAAAIAAERGDFDKAIRWQKKALKDAKKLKLPIAGREAHLALYREGKPLREAP